MREFKVTVEHYEGGVKRMTTRTVKAKYFDVAVQVASKGLGRPRRAMSVEFEVPKSGRWLPEEQGELDFEMDRLIARDA